MGGPGDGARIRGQCHVRPAGRDERRQPEEGLFDRDAGIVRLVDTVHVDATAISCV